MSNKRSAFRAAPVRAAAGSSLRTRPITVAVHEVQTYILNGWRLVDEPHCSGAQMVPPERFLGDDPPPDPPQMRSPAIWQDGRGKSQSGIVGFSKKRLLPFAPICKKRRFAPPNSWGAI